MPPRRRFDGHHPGWAWKRDRRPPWWPESEEWPPRDEAGWRELRRGFMRRVGCFLIVGLVVLFVLFGVLVGVISSITSASYAVVAAVLLLVLFGVIVARLIRGVRWSAAPVADLIEAAGRVETGELDVQVPERGMAEVRALTSAFNAMSARLSATERERRRLLAEVSHELRTPLTVIQGNVEAMLDGVYPADREHLERIQAETRQLARLIDDLRTVSQAETGQLTLVREPANLADLAREVAAAFDAEASAAGIRLAVEADDEAEVEVDPFRMRQVIANLVSNALRHTPAKGSVTIAVRRRAGDFAISVADTGAGMAADAVEHAFERFWRSGESAGAGLGLAIVRDLVTAHGGSVSIASQPGSGTTVTALLPAGTTARGGPPV